MKFNALAILDREPRWRSLSFNFVTDSQAKCRDQNHGSTDSKSLPFAHCGL
jgi:hypothetical protein